MQQKIITTDNITYTIAEATWAGAEIWRWTGNMGDLVAYARFLDPINKADTVQPFGGNTKTFEIVMENSKSRSTFRCSSVTQLLDRVAYLDKIDRDPFFGING